MLDCGQLEGTVDILYCCQLVLASLTVSLTLGQVNQEIYSEEDLLAIDSGTHNTVVIAPPPANFLSSNSVEGKSLNQGRINSKNMTNSKIWLV